MGKQLLITLILAFGISVANAQLQVEKTDIKLKEIGRMKTRKASEIKASYLGIGCDVLDRDFACYDNYKEYLGNLGVKHARFQSGWTKTEKQKGVYDFSWLDNVINDCRSRGIQPWVNTVYGNTIYDGGGDMQSSSKLPYTEEALLAWDAYVRNLVTHFRTRVFEWEIWNEIDHGGFKASSPEQYAEFYIRTAQIIREIQPNGKVIALALAGVGDNKFVRGFLDYLKAKGKLYLIDKVSFHGYPNNPDTGFDKSKELINLLKQYDERIVAFQGETGCPSTKGSSGALSNYPYTELSQSKWDLRRAVAHIGRGIQFSLFTLSEFNYPGNRLNTKGKLKIDEKLSVVYAKPSYFSYQNLTSLFDSTVVAIDPAGFSVKSDSASVIYAFVDSKKELAAVTYWNSGSIPSERLTAQNAMIKLKSAKFRSPILVDVRTGVVYEIPKSAISQQGDYYEFKLPVYDSPLLICNRKFILKRGLL
jgi:hypothetical protein